MNDIRVASGYTAPLRRSSPLEERAYTPDLVLNPDPAGATCPTSGVRWNEDAAWKLACEGPSRVRQLLLGPRDGGPDAQGRVVPFDRVGGEAGDDALSLCLEASHSAPRIVHHADNTGMVITQSITRAAGEHPLIDFVGDSIATDLIADEDSGAVVGATVLDRPATTVRVIREFVCACKHQSSSRAETDLP